MKHSWEELTHSHVTRVRGWVTREVNKAKVVLGTTPDLSIEFYQRVSNTVVQKFDSYDTLYAAYVVHETDEELIKKEDTERDKKDDEVNEILLKLQRKIDSLKARSSKTTEQVQSEASVVAKPKFPTIQVPEFSGKHEEWAEFWDVFNSLVHSNKSIDIVLKFTLLRNALTGKAKESIKGFKTTEADYEEAIAFLKETYADKKKVKRLLVRRLLDMKKPSLTYNSLLSFQQDAVSTMRSLNQFEDVESSEWLIVELLQRLLPLEVEKFIVQRYKTEYVSMKDLIKGLSDFINWMDQSKEYTTRSDGKSKDVDKDRIVKASFSSGKKDIGNYSTAVAQKVNRGMDCLFCGMSNHTSPYCRKINDTKGRKEKLKELKRCFKCTLYGHFANDCKVNLLCNLCKRKGHHSVFCHNADRSSGGNFFSNGSSKLKTTSTENQKSTADATTHLQSAGVIMVSSQRMKTIKPTIPSCALPTATGTVCNDKIGQESKVRIFFDQGSQCSFITKELVNKLGLEIKEELTLGIKAFRSEIKEQIYKIAEAVVEVGTRKARIRFLVIDDFPLTIYTPGISKAAQELTNAGFRMADDNIQCDVLDGISIIIGASHFGKFIGRFKEWKGYNLMVSPGEFVLLYGEIPGAPSPQINGVHHAVVMRITSTILPMESVDMMEEETKSVNKIWELDAIGIITKNEMAYEDAEAKENYMRTVRYDGNQYWVRLPWKSIHPPLPNNYKQARGQLTSLLTTLTKNSTKFENYDNVIKQQLENGFIEPVTEDNPYKVDCHYLPHHGVSKESATTPLRVVFNCSSKTQGSVSLNDCLMTGPSLTEKLTNILLKFRCENYAYTADISKAFLRVGLQLEDRDFTRFLWIQDVNEVPYKIVTYRFKSVLFGSTSSPFLLQATIEKHLRCSSSQLANKILSSFYVDNFQGTTNSEKELIEVFNEANIELAKANMPLQSWNSNNAKLQNIIKDFYPEETRLKQISVLGLLWDVDSDYLQVKEPKFSDSQFLTKRKLLSLVSSVFDPLGLLSPLLIRGKILIQEAWKLKLDWDERLPEQFNQEWEKLKTDLDQVTKLRFPRSVGFSNEDCHLKVYCDASVKGYGAVAYTVKVDGAWLLMSKARVAPLNARTLPQLELTAIFIGANLIHYITTQYPVNFQSATLYSDSEVALKWIQNDTSKIVYVKNRVAEIRRICIDDHVELKHITSKENPADILSRGCTITDLIKDDKWFRGPSKPVCHNVNLIASSEETISAIADKKPLFNIERVSSLTKLLKITSIVFRFINLFKPVNSLPRSELSYWIKYEQNNNFHNIYQILTSKTRANANYESKNMVKQLGLFIGEDGILRCRGRIQHSSLEKTGKFPILLPSKSYLTKLIIKREHQKCQHGGVGPTLCSLRMNFWIPRGRQVVKNIINNCIYCKKVIGKGYTYPGPPPLPEERVCLDIPFKTVGVDYSGGIQLSKSPEAGKYYVCLFTCTASRAVHLELVSDLSAETFILILRKFIARRSLPKKLISDNATNFSSAAKFLKELSQEPGIKNFMEEQKIEWQFIAPRAPWQGGFYERLIGIVKSCLKKTLYKRKLNRQELETVLSETEAIINNRPLTYLHEDINNEEVLTPSLLLHGRNIRIFPSLLDDNEFDAEYGSANALRDNYVKLSKILKKFKIIWQKDYITALRERHYGAQSAVNKQKINVGDVVLVQTDEFRDFWPLGRIAKLNDSSDGVVRSAEVLVKGKIVQKTIEKLVPLEADLSNCKNLYSVGSTDETSAKERIVGSQRPRRQAALQADTLRKNLIHEDLL